MILRFVILLIFVIARSGCKIDEKQKEERLPYFFPGELCDNVIEETKALLSSQKTYQVEIDKLFQSILQKNRHSEDFEELKNYSLVGIIEFADELITNSTIIIDEFLKNGSTDDYFKKEPLNYTTARDLTDCWKYIDDFLDDYIKMFDFDLGDAVELMQEPVDLAMCEIEEYLRYLDKLYNETKRYRDELYFRYPKYGRPYLQALQNVTEVKKVTINLAYDTQD